MSPSGDRGLGVRSFCTHELGLDTCSNVGELKDYDGIALICRSDGWDRLTEQEALNQVLGTCKNNNIGEVKRVD